MSLLILRSGALGDTLLTFHAARALMADGEAVTVWGRAAWAGLARWFGIEYLAGEASDFDRLYRGDDAPVTENLLARFDRVCAFKSDPDGSLAALLGKSHPRLKVIAPLPPQGYAKPYPAYLLEMMGARAPETFAPLASPIGRGGALAVAPGSGSEKKNWPVERYAVLLRRAQCGVDVYLGPAEEEGPRRREMLALGGINGVSLIRGEAIDAVADRLSRAARYVGGDSGLTHLAAALGLPVLALWGQTDSLVWGPMGPGVSVLHAPGGDLGRLEVEPVTRALEES